MKVSMKNGMYESPAAEVLDVRMERTILSVTNASRASYGPANDGMDSGQLDGDGNWIWN